MNQQDKLKAWSIQDVEKWKNKVMSGKYAGLIDFSAVALTEEYYAGLKSEAYIQIFRKWPNGNYCWLPKADADLIQKSVPNYKRKR